MLDANTEALVKAINRLAKAIEDANPRPKKIPKGDPKKILRESKEEAKRSSNAKGVSNVR